MGKNWFSALKRAFTASSKDSITYGSENKYRKEKKKRAAGSLENADINSFIPLHREPSSIEKILGDAELEQQHNLQQEPPKRIQHFHSLNEEPPKKVQHFEEPQQEPLKNVQNFRAPKPKPKPKPKPTNASSRRAINMSYAQSSAMKIQTAYRGYMARKTYRVLKGLIRLQKVMRGQSVKQQTINTMKCMQLLVRVQSQIRARRLHMIESKNLQHQHQTLRRSEVEMEINFSRWNRTPQLEAEVDGEWDDSMLTTEERDMRMRRKVEAVIKRERALAYAYSHQLLKVTPKSAHAVLTDIRSGGSPWWWNWLDRQLPNEPPPKTPTVSTPKLVSITPSATNFQSKKLVFPPTPRSSKPMPSTKTKNSLKSSNNWNQTQLSDNESLTSCPAFRPVPNYMAPTVSAKAKVRENRDVNKGGKKKFSFNLTQSIGNLFVAKENVQVKRDSKGKHRSSNSVGGMSVDSTVSLPVAVGRKASK